MFKNQTTQGRPLIDAQWR